MAAFAVVIGSWSTIASRVDEPIKGTQAPRNESPIPIFVNAPTDLSAILKRFDQPDFVILRGEEYNRLAGNAKGKAETPAPRNPAIVESISASGNLKDDVVEFLIDFVIAKETDARAWVPLHLDGLTLSGAKEEGRDLPLRVANGLWEVELASKGSHLVKVRLFLKVKQSAEGNRIDLAIPEAAATRLQLEVPRRVIEALAGPGELLTKEYLPSTSRTRLSADLIPRSRLGILWINEEEAVAQLPPLLVTHAEMAMDIDLGSLRVRTSWAIHSARGVAKSLEVVLGPDDEVLELELDGQTPPAGIERGKGSTRLTIPLTEPLEPGRERMLALTTRRPLSSQGPVEVAFKGYPITNASEQSGVIGIVQSGNLGVSALPGRGIRQIDPISELPLALRLRPATTLAYQFSEQPFELGLRIEPSPPLVRSESRTTITLQSEQAEVDTWLDFQAARGRLFEVNLSVPASLKIDSIGPEDVVRTWQAGSLPSSLTTVGPAGGVQFVTVKLAGKIQEGGRFSIQIRGKKTIDRLGHVGIAFVEPIGTISGGGRVVVLASPSLSLELDEPQGSSAQPAVFRSAALTPPADWPWPTGKAPQPRSQPMLWLRHDHNPSELALRVAFQPKRLLETIALNARVGATTIDVRQDTECQPRFGTYDFLEVLVPKSLDGRWQVEGAEVDSLSEKGSPDSNERLVRLRLFSEMTRSTQLQFHYDIPIVEERARASRFVQKLPLIRVVGSSPESKPPVAKVVGAPGYEVESIDPSWIEKQRATENGLNTSSEIDQLLEARAWDAKSLELSVQRKTLAELPSLVVSRHLIQTVVDSRGQRYERSLFWVQRHDGALDVRLPPRSKLSMANVADESITQVEELSKGRGLRIRFPGKVGRDPVLVELAYTTAALAGETAWSPPKLLNGGVIHRTFWEVALPWNQAAVGTPSGWMDENEWYWDYYVWKRRPRIASPELRGWVGSGSRAADGRGAAPSTAHGYLFGYAGKPSPLKLTIASRALLVGVCSGTVLLVGGLLIVVVHPSARWTGLAIVLSLFVAATFFETSVFFLAVQSGYVGLVLTLLLGLMQRVVDRRRPTSIPPVDHAASAVIPVGSTVSRTVGVGSDDSTAIRGRPPELGEASSNHAIAAALRPPGTDDDLTRRSIRSPR